MIRRTRDTKLIREILSDELLSERVTIGGNVDMFDPENQHALYYLEVIDDDNGVTLGFYMGHAMNSQICFQAHANFLPKYWGTGLYKYGVEAMQWMFEHTAAQKIMAFCPEAYPEVRHYAEKTGMKQEGILTKSSLYNDELCDNYIMGITREELCSLELS